MYSIDPKTNNITLVRGDYFACSISMIKGDEPFVPADGTLRFAVKRKYSDTDDKVLIVKQVPLDTMLLELESADTKDLRFGEYVQTQRTSASASMCMTSSTPIRRGARIRLSEPN